MTGSCWVEAGPCKPCPDAGMHVLRTHLAGHNGRAQVCEGVQASAQAQQAPLRPLLSGQGVPFVPVLDKMCSSVSLWSGEHSQGRVSPERHMPHTSESRLQGLTTMFGMDQDAATAAGRAHNIVPAFLKPVGCHGTASDRIYARVRLSHLNLLPHRYP